MNAQIIITAIKYFYTNPENWNFPWCAVFINKILAEVGSNKKGTLMARSFLMLGEHADKPTMGDIVVLWRVDKASPWGHAGFYIWDDATNFYLLGGNQDGTVKIKRYPKWQLLDIRTNYV